MFIKKSLITLLKLIGIIYLLITVLRIINKDPLWVKTPGFELYVVDKETQQALAGAKVEIGWREFAGGSCGGSHNRTFNKIKSVTDQSGKIHVPPNFSTHFFTKFEALSCDVTYLDYQERAFALLVRNGPYHSGPITKANSYGTVFKDKIAYVNLDKKR